MMLLLQVALIDMYQSSLLKLFNNASAIAESAGPAITPGPRRDGGPGNLLLSTSL